MVTLDLDPDGHDLLVRFPYSKDSVEKIRTLTRRWDKDERVWRLTSARLDELLEAFPQAAPSQRVNDFYHEVETLRTLRGATDGPLVPEIACELFPHQRAAVAFLERLSHGALFDEPGTGKTRASIAWAVKRAPDGPHVVICPAAVKLLWQREIRICRPDDSVQVVWATDLLDRAQWTILNYDILYRFTTGLEALKPHTLIADEVHYAQAGRRSRRGNAVLELAQHLPNVLAVTGSPILNRPSELEPILLMLRKLRTEDAFCWRVRFCDGHRICINEKSVKYWGKPAKMRWSFKGSSNLQLLAKVLSHFSLRRSKRELLGGLPAIHTPVEVKPSDLSEYNGLYGRMMSLVAAGDPKSRGEALGLMTKMLIAAAMAKCVNALELIRERFDSGQKVVVFSEWLDPLGELRAQLPDQSLTIDGSLNAPERQAVVERFVASRGPLALLVSRRAAGVGVDGLQHATDTCMFLSYPFSPEMYTQSVSRVDRSGQTSQVQSLALIAKGTVEEEILELLYAKAGTIALLSGRPSVGEKRRATFERMLAFIGGIHDQAFAASD